MGEQGGALGELRAAINRRVWAETDHRNEIVRASLASAITRRNEARAALESALAAVEARLAAYERFVRADDDLDGLSSADGIVWSGKLAVKRAARAALSAEDVAGEG